MQGMYRAEEQYLKEEAKAGLASTGVSQSGEAAEPEALRPQKHRRLPA